MRQNETQDSVFAAFDAQQFGDDVVAIKAAGYGGILGDEYLRGVRGMRALSDKTSVAYGAWRAGCKYRVEGSLNAHRQGWVFYTRRELQQLRNERKAVLS